MSLGVPNDAGLSRPDRKQVEINVPSRQPVISRLRPEAETLFTKRLCSHQFSDGFFQSIFGEYFLVCVRCEDKAVRMTLCNALGASLRKRFVLYRNERSVRAFNLLWRILLSLLYHSQRRLRKTQQAKRQIRVWLSLLMTVLRVPGRVFYGRRMGSIPSLVSRLQT